MQVSGRVHLRRGDSRRTFCGIVIWSGVAFVDVTSEVVEQGAGAGTGVTCEDCADNYRAERTRKRRLEALERWGRNVSAEPD